nr:MAG TPA: hypothetical protein [Caudoviricetes sp.]
MNSIFVIQRRTLGRIKVHIPISIICAISSSQPLR